MAAILSLKKLTGGVKTLIGLAQAYVEKYPNRAFLFVLDGNEVAVGTNNPVSIHIRNAQETLGKIFRDGSLALGDAFVDGAVDGELFDIAEWARFLLCVSQDKSLLAKLSFGDKVRLTKAILASYLEPKSGNGNHNDVNHHYSLEAWGVDHDRSNRFFGFLLGRTRVYSCGWWGNGAPTLEEAQYDKFDEYANLLELGVGKRLIDLGCGWGTQSLSYAKRGVDVTLVTLSDAQADFINRQIESLGLQGRARVLKMDMLNVDQLDVPLFDAALSIGAIEHVADFDTLFRNVRGILRGGGKVLWHTMYNKNHVPFDAWMANRMWPGVQIPSQERLLNSLWEHFKDVTFKPYPQGSYSRTFSCWLKNFITNQGEMRALIPGTPEEQSRFMRAFGWYLACCSIVYDVYMDVGFALCEV